MPRSVFIESNITLTPQQVANILPGNLDRMFIGDPVTPEKLINQALGQEAFITEVRGAAAALEESIAAFKAALPTELQLKADSIKTYALPMLICIIAITNLQIAELNRGSRDFPQNRALGTRLFDMLAKVRVAIHEIDDIFGEISETSQDTKTYHAILTLREKLCLSASILSVDAMQKALIKTAYASRDKTEKIKEMSGKLQPLVFKEIDYVSALTNPNKFIISEYVKDILNSWYKAGHNVRIADIIQLHFDFVTLISEEQALTSKPSETGKTATLIEKACSMLTDKIDSVVKGKEVNFKLPALAPGSEFFKVDIHNASDSKAYLIALYLMAYSFYTIAASASSANVRFNKLTAADMAIILLMQMRLQMQKQPLHDDLLTQRIENLTKALVNLLTRQIEMLKDMTEEEGFKALFIEVDYVAPRAMTKEEMYDQAARKICNPGLLILLLILNQKNPETFQIASIDSSITELPFHRTIITDVKKVVDGGEVVSQVSAIEKTSSQTMPFEAPAFGVQMLKLLHKLKMLSAEQRILSLSALLTLLFNQVVKDKKGARKIIASLWVNSTFMGEIKELLRGYQDSGYATSLLQLEGVRDKQGKRTSQVVIIANAQHVKLFTDKNLDLVFPAATMDSQIELQVKTYREMLEGYTSTRPILKHQALGESPLSGLNDSLAAFFQAKLNVQHCQVEMAKVRGDSTQRKYQEELTKREQTLETSEAALLDTVKITERSLLASLTDEENTPISDFVLTDLADAINTKAIEFTELTIHLEQLKDELRKLNHKKATSKKSNVGPEATETSADDARIAELESQITELLTQIERVKKELNPLYLQGLVAAREGYLSLLHADRGITTNVVFTKGDISEMTPGITVIVTQFGFQKALAAYTKLTDSSHSITKQKQEEARTACIIAALAYKRAIAEFGKVFLSELAVFRSNLNYEPPVSLLECLGIYGASALSLPFAKSLYELAGDWAAQEFTDRVAVLRAAASASKLARASTDDPSPAERSSLLSSSDGVLNEHSSEQDKFDAFIRVLTAIIHKEEGATPDLSGFDASVLRGIYSCLSKLKASTNVGDCIDYVRLAYNNASSSSSGGAELSDQEIVEILQTGKVGALVIEPGLVNLFSDAQKQMLAMERASKTSAPPSIDSNASLRSSPASSSPYTATDATRSAPNLSIVGKQSGEGPSKPSSTLSRTGSAAQSTPSLTGGPRGTDSTDDSTQPSQQPTLFPRPKGQNSTTATVNYRHINAALISFNEALDASSSKEKAQAFCEDEAGKTTVAQLTAVIAAVNASNDSGSANVRRQVKQVLEAMISLPQIDDPATYLHSYHEGGVAASWKPIFTAALPEGAEQAESEAHTMTPPLPEPSTSPASSDDSSAKASQSKKGPQKTASVDGTPKPASSGSTTELNQGSMLKSVDLTSKAHLFKQGTEEEQVEEAKAAEAQRQAIELCDMAERARLAAEDAVEGAARAAAAAKQAATAAGVLEGAVRAAEQRLAEVEVQKQLADSKENQDAVEAAKELKNAAEKALREATAQSTKCAQEAEQAAKEAAAATEKKEMLGAKAKAANDLLTADADDAYDQINKLYEQAREAAPDMRPLAEKFKIPAAHLANQALLGGITAKRGAHKKPKEDQKSDFEQDDHAAAESSQTDASSLSKNTASKFSFKSSPSGDPKPAARTPSPGHSSD